MNLCFLAVLVLAVGYSDHVSAEENSGHFLNEWAVEIQGGERQARSVAAQHGYKLVRELKSLPDHYILQRQDVPHRSRRSADHHTIKLSDDHRVSFVAQQQQKSRVKRGYISRHAREEARDIARQGGKLSDPELVNEWYLGASTNGDSKPKADLKVKEVWKKGFTGKGVVVTILDDGIEKSHPDLEGNYDAEASYDFNGEDDDPTPRYDATNENKHGTRCGGEIAMIANNNKCGTGIAFDAKIGGIRMLDGHVTDRLEGDALCYHNEHVDIYSASWGPNDDGKTTEGPGPLATKAFEQGMKKGRDGKGALYVWASGNGGTIGDNCNSDGYTSKVYTMSISSASQNGNSPWYSEKCSSTLATTYSSGSSHEGKVISADLHGKCTNSHSGTSAAAPMAAGIYALLLEANQNLTWRDVQHITVHTARMEPLDGEHGWYRNAAGYCVNLAFGFGLMDALAMVELADPASWQHVGEQRICNISNISPTFPQNLSAGNQVEIEFTTDGCQGQTNEVNFLEHVQVILDMDYSRRGNIYAELESPSGTITSLMLERKYDTSKKGFDHWPLMSVHTWGEAPNGTWKFRVADRSKTNETGSVKSAELILYGTKEQPHHQKANPKHCGAPAKVSRDQLKDQDGDTSTGSLQSLLHKPGGVNPGDLQNSLMNLVSKLQTIKEQSVNQPSTSEKDITDMLDNLLYSQ